MKKSIYLITTAIFVLSACASNRWVASNKAANYTDQPKKIFFRVEVAQADPFWGAEFIRALELELARSLQARQVTANYTAFNPVSLETAEDVKKAIEAFAPDAILTITKTVPYNDNDLQINNLDIKMMNVTQDKILWRGSLNRSGMLWVGSNGGTQCAKAIVNRLSKDGLVK